MKKPFLYKPHCCPKAGHRRKRAGSTERFETTHPTQVALKLLLPRHERQGIGWLEGRNWLEKDV
jgi:hypothetical protein